MVNLNHSAPLLAGVCSQLAKTFGCSVWALRAVFIVLLLVKTLFAVVAYAVLALLFQAGERFRNAEATAPFERPEASAEFSPVNRKLAELDRRFREWENSLGR